MSPRWAPWWVGSLRDEDLLSDMDTIQKPTKDELSELQQLPDEVLPKRKRISGAEQRRRKKARLNAIIGTTLKSPSAPLTLVRKPNLDQRGSKIVSASSTSTQGSANQANSMAAGADSTTSATSPKVRFDENFLNSRPTKKIKLHLGQTPDEIVSEETKHRHVAIVDLQNPFGKINQVQADQIKEKMLEILDNYLFSAVDGQHIPTFRGWQYVGEVLRIVCEDDESLKWLETAVINLPILWEGARLKLIQVDRLVKKVLWIPGKPESTDIVIRRLAGQNPWAGVRNWCLFRNVEKEEPLGRLLVFGLSKETEAIVKSKGYKLYYQFSTVILKNIGDVSTDSEQQKSVGEGTLPLKHHGSTNLL